MKTVVLKYTDPITLETKIVRKEAINYFQRKMSAICGRIKDLQNSKNPDRFLLISILDKEYMRFKKNLLAITDI